MSIKAFTLAICLGCVFHTSLVAWQEAPRPYKVASETTHFTGPLKENGDLDFFAIINDRHGLRLTRESNAAVLLLPVLDLEGDPLKPMLTRIGVDDPDVRHRPVSRLPENLKETFQEATKGSWNAAQYPKLAEWVASNEFALPTIRAAATRPFYHVPLPPADGMVALCVIPDVQTMRELGRLMLAQVTLSLSNDNIDQAVADIKTIQGMVNQLGNGSCVIISLVGTRLHEQACDAMAAVASSDVQLMAGQWQQIREAWGYRDKMVHVDVLDICERALVLDTVTWVARNGVTAEFHSNFGDFRVDLTGMRFRLFQKKLEGIDDWSSVLAKTNRRFDKVVAAWKLADTAKRITAINRLNEVIDQERKDFKSSVANVATIAATDAESLATGYCSSFLPIAFQRINEVELKRLNEHRVVSLALAIRQYYRNVGRFPATLQELPDLNESDYQDLFSGRPYEYASDETGFRLVTLGADGKSNGDVSRQRNRDDSDDWGIDYRMGH